LQRLASFVAEQSSSPFIRSLYRRIPLEFYGKITKTIYEIFAALWGYQK
jgi:hypothetical protein